MTQVVDVILCQEQHQPGLAQLPVPILLLVASIQSQPKKSAVIFYHRDHGVKMFYACGGRRSRAGAGPSVSGLVLVVHWPGPGHLPDP